MLLMLTVIGALVVGWQVAAFAAHPEASLPFSNFEIDTDANLKTEDASPSYDWDALQNTTNDVTKEIRIPDKVNGTGDNSYDGGVKEDTPCPTQKTDSVPPNKSDLLSFHVNQEPGNANNSSGYLNLAWSRVSEPSGTTLMDFEFNANSPTGTGACGGD